MSIPHILDIVEGEHLELLNPRADFVEGEHLELLNPRADFAETPVVAVIELVQQRAPNANPPTLIHIRNRRFQAGQPYSEFADEIQHEVYTQPFMVASGSQNHLFPVNSQRENLPPTPSLDSPLHRPTGTIQGSAVTALGTATNGRDSSSSLPSSVFESYRETVGGGRSNSGQAVGEGTPASSYVTQGVPFPRDKNDG